METLVSWKKKREIHRDEMDEDEDETYGPRLGDTMQDVQFIRRDETNAKAMRKLKIKWW